MYCTEALPGHQTDLVVSRLMSWDVPVTVIADSAVAFHMGKVDMVLVGAQGVVENGGILNKMGTLQIAIVARSYNKPLYVASESYKFARIFPLDQTDLTIPGAALDFTPPECEQFAVAALCLCSVVLLHSRRGAGTSRCCSLILEC